MVTIMLLNPLLSIGLELASEENGGKEDICNEFSLILVSLYILLILLLTAISIRILKTHSSVSNFDDNC
jgi:hypothetical protein